MILIDGFDDAIIGRATIWDAEGGRSLVLVYDGDRIIKTLVRRDGMTQDDAREYCSFNIEGAYMGVETPIITWKGKLSDYV